jgi:prepilin-type processing-associated H-X9-DG protein/prepilin-type N-terminal cleavage/methylation domain-containing protein
MNSAFLLKTPRSRDRFSPPAYGWTLVELLVVIVIVAVLASAVFALSKRGLASARAATCVSNVRQVGMAILAQAGENHNKLIPLQPSKNSETGKRPPIWTVQLAREGYLSSWNGKGDAPCGKGVWTGPECDFMSNAYGGYGVVEGAIFAYEEGRAFGAKETGSLRLTAIKSPSRTWLLGDASPSAAKPEKGWYAIWSPPARWSTHGPAGRHRGKVNVCMVDGHVESLTVDEIKERKLTEDVIRD